MLHTCGSQKRTSSTFFSGSRLANSQLSKLLAASGGWKLPLGEVKLSHLHQQPHLCSLEQTRTPELHWAEITSLMLHSGTDNPSTPKSLASFMITGIIRSWSGANPRNTGYYTFEGSYPHSHTTAWSESAELSCTLAAIPVQHQQDLSTR